MERIPLKATEEKQPQPPTALEADIQRVRNLHANGYSNLIIIGIAEPDENKMHLYYPLDAHPLDIAQALQNALDSLYDSTGAAGTGLNSF